MEHVQDTTDPRVGTSFIVDGWAVRVDTAPDEDASPLDADCYTSEQIDAWKRDEWSYVGCVVTASREGIELGHASLWGIESGWFTYTTENGAVTATGYVGPYTEAVDSLITEAIADGTATLARLCGEVQKITKVRARGLITDTEAIEDVAAELRKIGGE